MPKNVNANDVFWFWSKNSFLLSVPISGTKINNTVKSITFFLTKTQNIKVKTFDQFN